MQQSTIPFQTYQYPMIFRCFLLGLGIIFVFASCRDSVVDSQAQKEFNVSNSTRIGNANQGNFEVENILFNNEILIKVQDGSGYPIARNIHVRRFSDGYALSGISNISYGGLFPSGFNWGAQVNEDGDLGSLSERLLRFTHYLFYIED